MIGKIASAIFAAIICVIVGLLWSSSSTSFKDEVSRSASLGLQALNQKLQTIFNPKQTADVQSHDKAKSPGYAGYKHTTTHGSKQFSDSGTGISDVIKVQPRATSSSSGGLHLKPQTTADGKKIALAVRKHGKPVQFIKTNVMHIPLYETIIDLQDPECFIGIGLANNAILANDVHQSHGDESFESFVKKAHASVVMNGTFFSKDDQKRVMGNMVSGGRFLKYSPWENFGTTFGLLKGNEPQMVTARADGAPRWDNCWFSLTCGPRLLKDGEPWIHPELEGFSDSHVLGIGPRCALGFDPAKHRLILCTFMYGLSLLQEAKLMKELGCTEAMNLDGGASRSLAYNGSVLVPAGRPLTNVLMVYDAKNHAPEQLRLSWERFQQGHYPAKPPY